MAISFAAAFDMARDLRISQGEWRLSLGVLILLALDLCRIGAP